MTPGAASTADLGGPTPLPWMLLVRRDTSSGLARATARGTRHAARRDLGGSGTWVSFSRSRTGMVLGGPRPSVSRPRFEHGDPARGDVLSNGATP